MNTRWIIGTNELVGVQAEAAADGSVRFGWVHVRKDRKGVHIVRQGVAESAKALAKEVGARYPLALVHLSDRLLVRSSAEPFQAERDLQKWLPNARAEDLLVDSFTAESVPLVCVARSEPVSELLRAITEAGLRPISLRIGPWVAFVMREHWTTTGAYGPWRFDRAPDGSWTVLHNPDADEPLNFGGQHVGSTSVLALAACWQHWFDPLESSAPEPPLVVQARSEERYRLFYERASLGLVVILLLLVGSNLWLRTRLAGAGAEVHAAVALQARQQAELDSLRSSLLDCRQLLNSSGFANAGRDMRIIDQVARSTPDAVRLTELWMSPATHALRADEDLQRRDGILSIAGSTTAPAALPEWVGALNLMESVRSARLISMGSSPEQQGLIFRIELEL